MLALSHQSAYTCLQGIIMHQSLVLCNLTAPLCNALHKLFSTTSTSERQVIL